MWLSKSDEIEDDVFNEKSDCIKAEDCMLAMIKRSESIIK